MLPIYEPLKNNEVKENWFCTTPLYQQAFRWFRERHNLHSWIKKGKHDDYIYEIIGFGKDSWDTHEEAQLEYLKKLIEIVKQK